ncbi:MAG: hypothetical protein JW913_05660 [Chitinispirillaceae bacterium]|nr:hypothetical protein [Chitinispirillaceae bacterium]
MSNEQQKTKINPIGSKEENEKQKPQREQSPLLGCGAGILAVTAGTALWIVIAQKYKMPVMSLAIAFGIASAIRYAGKTKDVWYGFIGAGLSFIAAIAGNIATGIFIYCVKYPSMTPKAILSNLNVENAITLIQPVGWPMVIICSLASVCIGFWFAFKHTPKRIMDLP